ncbi:phage minor capsid protein [Gordonia terrae]
MELSPHQAEALAQRIVELYSAAEYELLAKLAHHLGKGLDTDDHWAERQLAEIQRFQRVAWEILEKLGADSAAAVAGVIGQAGNRGGAIAVASMMSGGVMSTAVDPFAVTAIAAELEQKLAASRGRIFRSVDDIYRKVIVDSTPLVNAGTISRREAADRALRRLASNGVTGFIDRQGKRWEMASYVEMASRQATKEAAIQGHTDRLVAQGHNLVVISDVPQECADCRPFEGKVLALKPDGQHKTLDDARRAGLFHPGCVVGETRVSPGGGIGVSDSRWYEGPIVVIKTALGDELAITPNHPILTLEGWVAAGELMVGADVVRSRREIKPVNGMSPDQQQVPPPISEIHRAFLDASEVSPVRVPTAAHDFHGDGGDSEVEVISADGLLEDRIEIDEKSGEFSLLVGGVRLPLLLGASDLESLLVGVNATSGGLVGGGSQGPSLCPTHAAEAAGHGFTASESLVAVTTQPGTEGWLGESDGSGRFLLGQLAGQVTADSVVEIIRRDFAGHVYNLQCENGWYAANSIVVHNCRHSLSRYQPGRTRSFGETADPEGDKARQKLRYLERQVRAAKREKAAALDDAGRRKATARVRAYEAKIREHVATTSAKRQRHRERVSAAR